MHEVTTPVIQALGNSKQVLFVMHEYLPLPLALWVPTLVSLLKKQGKEITVLVSQNVMGWPKRIDEVYPTDMVLALEQLRQVISVPITNKSESVGDVSYRIADGNLEITVVPIKETLDTTQMKAITQGKIYETVIGVGISASHPLLNVLQGSQASLSRSKAFFVGTYAMHGALVEKLSFIPSVTVLDSKEDQFLREVLQQVSGDKELEPAQRELVTLFIQSIVAATQQFEYLDKEGYEYLGKIADDSMDSGRMASLYSGDFAKQNRILQQILQSAQKSSTGELLLFSVTAQQISQLGTNVQDVVTALYYLPKYPQVKQVIVVIEEHLTRHHVYMNGQPESVKQVAMKYGFPKTERLTGGVIEEINFEKVCRDVTRVAVKEELAPIMGIPLQQIQTTPVVTANEPEERINPEGDEAESKVSITQPEIVVSPSIPVVPTLDQVLANPVMSDSEMDSGEVVDVEPPQVTPPVAEPAVVTSESTTPTVQVRTSNGLDFAAIAKKMRESIS